MQEHFMISECDGGLYDTRLPNWSDKPIRPDYSKHFAEIETVSQFKATVRAGAFAWPGGDPLALYTNDGALLCFDCGHSEAYQIIDSIRSDTSDGWKVVGCGIEYAEESDAICDHCNKVIAEYET